MQTPKGFRLHIGIFGRRNAGKSSTLNALVGQTVSIVSEFAGTTTDPVEKPMELLPLGPVLFIDTAGMDDAGILGNLRMEQTRKVFDRTDLGIIVSDGGIWGEYETIISEQLQQRKIPYIAVFNKSDLVQPDSNVVRQLTDQKIPVVQTVASLRQGVEELRQAIIRTAPEDFVTIPTILGDLVPAGELVVFVVPIDKEAPKGRLILPQVQSIRDILDNDGYCMVVKERELRDALGRLNRVPALVVTDSQAFLKVAGDTPPEIPMTSFSILFARNKGDLCEMVRGAGMIDRLKPGSRILIGEACTHRASCEDIGRVKIPRWLRQYTGCELHIDNYQGRDLPEDISTYDLVIHCGACMWNRREMLSRIERCRQADVPITNYGLAIAWSLGIFQRALQPFPAALEVFEQMQKS